MLNNTISNLVRIEFILRNSSIDRDSFDQQLEGAYKLASLLTGMSVDRLIEEVHCYVEAAS